MHQRCAANRDSCQRYPLRRARRPLESAHPPGVRPPSGSNPMSRSRSHHQRVSPRCTTCKAAVAMDCRASKRRAPPSPLAHQARRRQVRRMHRLRVRLLLCFTRSSFGRIGLDKGVLLELGQSWVVQINTLGLTLVLGRRLLFAWGFVFILFLINRYCPKPDSFQSTKYTDQITGQIQPNIIINRIFFSNFSLSPF